MTKEQILEAVHSIYKAIFSLPDEIQRKALHAYWKSMSESCKTDSPCLECQADMIKQEQGD